MTITELKTNYTNEYNKGLESCGIFWAFDDKQFESNKIPKTAKENEFLSIGIGGFIHKSNRAKLDNFLNTTAKQLKQDFLSKANRNDLILYELLNHECFYTYELDECYESLKTYYDDITIEEIKKVFKKNQSKYDY